ncbi:MAG TPA: hypothetical protein VG125_03775 [Pirellulales bacterium]|nr:hypothetical protein [Pirellulales bacterium]
MEQNETPAGDDELVRALAAGATLREAAEQAGVEERTARGRLAEADFSTGRESGPRPAVRFRPGPAGRSRQLVRCCAGTGGTRRPFGRRVRLVAGEHETEC